MAPGPQQPDPSGRWEQTHAWLLRSVTSLLCWFSFFFVFLVLFFKEYMEFQGNMVLPDVDPVVFEYPSLAAEVPSVNGESADPPVAGVNLIQLSFKQTWDEWFSLMRYNPDGIQLVKLDVRKPVTNNHTEFPPPAWVISDWAPLWVIWRHLLLVLFLYLFVIQLPLLRSD